MAFKASWEIVLELWPELAVEILVGGARVYLFYYNIIGRYLVQIDESNVLVFLYTQARMNNGIV